MAMQDVINKMKGTALGVAEYLTPVLKVRSSRSFEFRFAIKFGDVSHKWICFYHACLHRNQSFKRLELLHPKK